MGLKDLIITPFYIVILTLVAYFIRPYVTNRQTRKYFLPALWVRFAGAIALGLIYQFYYGGGDTFNYWEHGSRHIYEAFQGDIQTGFKLLFSSGGQRGYDDTFPYASKIWYYKDVHSYFVVRIAAFFDLFTFHTYSATALFFAAFSFSGLWAMYTALQRKYHSSAKRLAIAILFVPSVVFWGSGILKDTIALGALGWMTWSLLRWIELRKKGLVEIMVFAVAFFLIFSIKKYILICYLPMVFVWLFFKYLKRVKRIISKLIVGPMLLVLFAGSGWVVLVQVSNTDRKYSLDNVAEQARITAYDIRYGWGARTGGDGGYDIGLMDGSWQSLIRLIPAAINVSLFRPYLWEVKNPLMLLNSIESLAVLFLTISMTVKRENLKKLSDPFLIFCLLFSFLFAFAIGVSTFNFGTLIRYKIPLMPFLITAIFIRAKA